MKTSLGGERGWLCYREGCRAGQDSALATAASALTDNEREREKKKKKKFRGEEKEEARQSGRATFPG